MEQLTEELDPLVEEVKAISADFEAACVCDKLVLTQVCTLTRHGGLICVGQRPRNPAAPTSFYQVWGALGANKWKERVRGADLSKGASSTHYDYQDGRFLTPNQGKGTYSSNLEKADQLVYDYLGFRLTCDMLAQMHRTAAAHQNAIKWRDEPKNLELPTPALKDFERKLPDGLKCFPMSEQNMLSPLTALRISQVTEDEAMARTQVILDDYAQACEQLNQQNTGQRLLRVASTIQSLVRLHPFYDYNTRAFMLVLNKMLVENGMTPAIMQDPKLAYLTTTEAWARMIQEGMDLWAKQRPPDSAPLPLAVVPAMNFPTIDEILTVARAKAGAVAGFEITEPADLKIRIGKDPLGFACCGVNPGNLVQVLDSLQAQVDPDDFT